MENTRNLPINPLRRDPNYSKDKSELGLSKVDNMSFDDIQKSILSNVSYYLNEGINYRFLSTSDNKLYSLLDLEKGGFVDLVISECNLTEDKGYVIGSCIRLQVQFNKDGSHSYTTFSKGTGKYDTTSDLNTNNNWIVISPSLENNDLLGILFMNNESLYNYLWINIINSSRIKVKNFSDSALDKTEASKIYNLSDGKFTKLKTSDSTSSGNKGNLIFTHGLHSGVNNNTPKPEVEYTFDGSSDLVVELGTGSRYNVAELDPDQSTYHNKTYANSNELVLGSDRRLSLLDGESAGKKLVYSESKSNGDANTFTEPGIYQLSGTVTNAPEVNGDMISLGNKSQLFISRSSAKMYFRSDGYTAWNELTASASNSISIDYDSDSTSGYLFNSKSLSIPTSGLSMTCDENGEFKNYKLWWRPSNDKNFDTGSIPDTYNKCLLIRSDSINYLGKPVITSSNSNIVLNSKRLNLYEDPDTELGYSYIEYSNTSSDGVKINFYNQSSNDNYGFNFTGGISVTGSIKTTEGYYEDSDKRLKTNLSDINIDLDDIEKLSTIKFTFRKDKSNKTHIGVIAQEVQELYPELVNTDNEGFLSVDYSKLSVISLASTKKLLKEIKDIKLELRNIKNSLNIK